MPSRLIPIRLNHRHQVPLYLQLAHAIRQQIDKGIYRSGESLPSERTIAETLRISRVTVRKALDQLQTQGIIEHRHGAGNYVASSLPFSRSTAPPSRLEGLAKLLQARGYSSSSRWLVRDHRVPPNDCLLRLGLPPETTVTYLKRQRLANQQVISVCEHYLIEGLIDDPNRLDDSLYDYLDQRGTPIVRALQQVSAINANVTMASLLNVPEGTALLNAVRTGYLGDGRAAELSLNCCRTDGYDFMTEINR